MKYNFDELVDRRGNNSVKWSDLDGRIRDEILPMWIADMDFKSADEILDALRGAVDHGVLGYTYLPDSFYESIINWTYERYDWKIEKEWIVFSPGVVPGLNNVIRAFTQEGDEVVVQPPVYPPFYRVMENNKTRGVDNPLVLRDGRYIMDLEDLERKIGEGTRLAMLCNPHNPVGRVWEREELEAFGELCLRNNILMISDEIHCDLTFKGHKHIPLASISSDIGMNTITFMAPSKTFNIAGLYSSVAIIENKEIRDRFVQGVEEVEMGDGTLFGAVGFEAAYKYGGQWLEEVLVYIEDNADYALDYIQRNIPEIKAYKPEGTYLMWLDFNSLGKTSEEIDGILIEKGRVKLNNGSSYGPGGEGFFRLNIGCPRKVLEEGLRRIELSLR